MVLQVFGFFWAVVCDRKGGAVSSEEQVGLAFLEVPCAATSVIKMMSHVWYVYREEPVRTLRRTQGAGRLKK